MFDEKKFREIVRGKGLSLNKVAKNIGLNPSTLYRKMTGESDFYRTEIQKLCTLLEIENPAEIFFAENIA